MILEFAQSKDILHTDKHTVHLPGYHMAPQRLSALGEAPKELLGQCVLLC